VAGVLGVAGKRRGAATLVSALSLLAGLAAWQVLAGGTSDLILPPPSAVAEKLLDPAFFRRLSAALGQSMVSLFAGFAISLAVAVPLGILLGRNRTAARTVEPVVAALYAIPPVAFVPFLVVWFGLFLPARIALVVLMTVFDVLLVVTAGARDVRRGLVEVGRSFGAGPLVRMRLVVLPALAPFLFAALRVGFARAVNGMITAELFFAAANLGGLMKRQSQDFDTAGVLMVVLVVCLLGLAGQAVLGAAEKRALHWHARA
jgi:ABC-type nitrate/sulfonate/bicarbonate transport system permease component